MKKFRKVVVIDDTGLQDSGKKELEQLAEKVVYYNDIPAGEQESIRRIGDADGVLVSYNTRITRNVIEACPGIRYIGMCCTLYSESSANVDIAAAREKGIVVLGIKDYGDEGVVEYIVYELVRLLHGYGPRQWKKEVYELTGQKVGIIGLGRTGKMIADALRFLGAHVYYYSRTRKLEAEQEGITYLPLEELLAKVDIAGTCLPRNTILCKKGEFNSFGREKIFFNTSVGVTFDVPALRAWLEDSSNFFLCDKVGMGGCENVLASLDNVLYTPKVAGHSVQCMQRLTDKVIANVRSFLEPDR